MARYIAITSGRQGEKEPTLSNLEAAITDVRRQGAPDDAKVSVSTIFGVELEARWEEEAVPDPTTRPNQARRW